MIEKSGIAIFLFGNKLDSTGAIKLADGVQKEFDLAVSSGVRVIPIGATGFMAESLHKRVSSDLNKFYPERSLHSQIRLLGKDGASNEELLNAVMKIITTLNKN
jgi:hypothetical protein